MLTYYAQSCSLIPLTMQYFCNTHQVDFVYNPHTYMSHLSCVTLLTIKQDKLLIIPNNMRGTVTVLLFSK